MLWRFRSDEGPCGLTSACCFHEKASLSIGRRGGRPPRSPTCFHPHSKCMLRSTGVGLPIYRAISKISSSNRSPRTGRLSS
jgi:hypothetical protein